MIIETVLFLTIGSGPSVKSADLVFAPMPKLVQVLGAVEPAPARVEFMTFHPKGFDKVLVDKAGAKMSYIEFMFDKSLPITSALSSVGLNGAHMRTRPLPNPAGKDGLLRHLLAVDGVGGVSRPWKIYAQEFAVLNKGRVASMKSKIKSLSGEQRFALIRTCYDWHTEIKLSLH